ncbi:MAG: LacI family DNA-binding transcriptional regulator [Proteobacteria bacterium]|nr:LacI family DNA-binding transcriptional regulator [Pseudomonadota bacterium]
MPGVTIHDVAAHAGVSISTASRALRGIGYVDAGKRELVLRAVAALGYVPDASAQALRARRSGVIGIVVGDLGNPHTATLVHSIEKYVSARGYTALFTSVVDDGEAMEQKALQTMLRQRPDGLIVATLQTHISDLLLQQARRAGLPTTLIGRSLASGDFDSITSNYQRGSEILTDYLLSLGHRRIAFVGAHLSEAEHVGRLRGYLAAMQRARIKVRPDWVVGDDKPARPYYPNSLTGYRAAKRLLQLRTHPSAIMARNDVTAIGVIQAITEAGLSVPEDVSVTGFDDIPLAGFIAPALTTMSQPTEKEGELAAEFLIARLERPDEVIAPRALTLECNLIVRASSARAPSR